MANFLTVTLPLSYWRACFMSLPIFFFAEVSGLEDALASIDFDKALLIDAGFLLA